MSKTVDYYFSPISPWTYLGHARFADMAKRHGAAVNVKPADFGKVFPVSGGLPLAKRAPQRQAYRLVELKRFRDHLKLPLNLQPKFFPAPARPGGAIHRRRGPRRRQLRGDAPRGRDIARLLGGGAQHRRCRNPGRDLQGAGHERRGSWRLRRSRKRSRPSTRLIRRRPWRATCSARPAMSSTARSSGGRTGSSSSSARSAHEPHK